MATVLHDMVLPVTAPPDAALTNTAQPDIALTNMATRYNTVPYYWLKQHRSKLQCHYNLADTGSHWVKYVMQDDIGWCQMVVDVGCAFDAGS